MTDLSNLPEDLQHVIKLADCDFSADYAFTPVELRDYTILRDYILRVTAERDALARRIADAPVAHVSLVADGENGDAGAYMHNAGDDLHALCGADVRLVKVE